MRSKVLASVACAAALAATLAACGGDSDSSSSSDCKIGLLLPENTTPRWETKDRPLITAAVKKIDSSCQVLSFNADGDVSKQQQQAETAVTQGAKVLILAPLDEESSGTIVDQAKSRNVPTIAYDRVSSGPAAAIVTFDNELIGQMQAQGVLDAMAKDGPIAGKKIVMLNGTPSSTGAQAFKRGAHSVLDKSGVDIAAEYDIDKFSPDLAATAMTQAITKVGKDQIAGVYVAADVLTGAAVNAMQQAKMDPIPPTSGLDTQIDGLQRVLLGTQTLDIWKNMEDEASIASELAVKLAKGDKLGKLDGVLKNKTGDELPARLLKPIVITADNMNEVLVKAGTVDPAELCKDDVAKACVAHGIVVK